MPPRPIRRSALAAVLLGAALASGCWRTKEDIQRDYARTLQPAQLAPAPAAPAELRAIAVRIDADEAYQTESVRWRERITAQVERTNRVLEAQFGVRLSVKGIRSWSRAGSSRGLPDALAELAAADPGDDVDWVIGFVSSTDLFSGSHEQLGLAQLFGRHLVVRGMISAEEGDAVNRALDAITEDERDALLHERQLHRETAVLLHEWAHTMGAFHERAGDAIMSPRYDPHQAAFSPESARIIQLGLSHRASTEPGARAAWAQAYRAEVERDRATAWDDATVEEAVAASRTLLEPVRRPGSGVGSSAGTRLGPEEAAILAQAETNDRAGDAARAWRLVEPVAARFPEDPRVQRYACYLRYRAEPGAPATLAACRSAASLPRAPGSASVLLGRLLLDAGDRGGAAAALGRAGGALAAASPAPPPREWAELADLLSSVDACTAAERAAARAPAETAARRAVATCARTRALAALPAKGAGVEPEREPEYVRAVRRARAEVEGGRVDRGRSAAIRLEEAYPGAPGGPLVRCLAEARSADPAAMRAACTVAARAAPWAYEPAYVLGVVAGHEGRWPEARDQLLRALERDELDRDTWAKLGAVYRRLGDAAGLEALEKRHRARFGSPLRPAW